MNQGNQRREGIIPVLLVVQSGSQSGNGVRARYGCPFDDQGNQRVIDVYLGR